jgi:serine/threonine-protein kinase
MEFEAGQEIGGYEVVRRLGAGGLGVVYEARHLISRRSEAMKVLLPEQTSTPEMAERFRREIQFLAALNHINIAALHNAFYHGDQLVMVMELVHGETLRQRSERKGISLEEALHYAAQILAALSFAHRVGIVHRDLKPSNVMITEANLVKLLDFGIAISDRSADLTNPGFLVGSLHYMSPEQVSGEKATPRSDIYSVGVTLYELLTGRLPSTGATTYEIMQSILQQAPLPPRQLNPAVPASVSAAILRALSKDPAQRFASAEEFAEAMRVHLAATESGRLAATTLLPRDRVRMASGSATRQAPGTSDMSQGMPLPIDEVTRQLAIYIGPVAKFLVKKLAANCTGTEQLYVEASKQISSEADRSKFLRSLRK